MTKLRDSKKLKFWSDSFGHSFSGLDILGGTSSEWRLIEVGEIGTNHIGGGFVLHMNVKRYDGMLSTQGIFSDDESFLIKLKNFLESQIGKSWEEIGNLEVI